MVLPGLVVAAGLCGCRTPGPVLKLSEQTGLNASQLADQLDNFAAHRGDLADRRAEIGAAISESAAGLVVDLEVSRQAMVLGGRADEIKMFDSVVAASEAVAQKYAESEVAADKQRTLVLQGLQKLDGAPKALNEMAKALAELGRDDDFKTRALFYGSFVQSVMKRVDELQAEKDAAAKAAAQKTQDLKNAAKQPSDANKSAK